VSRIRALAVLGLLAAAPVAAEKARPIRDCAACGELVVVPAGRFDMGGPGGEEGRPEGPVRRVTIAAPFALGRTEVTNAQYDAFVAATGRVTAGRCRTFDGKQWVWSEGHGREKPVDGFVPKPDEPVVCVSWRDAKAFTDWLAKTTGKPYRLPTEAEWEYAARAGSTTAYAWGEDENDGCRAANYYDEAAAGSFTFGWRPAMCSDGHAHLAPVGSLAANAFGLHDMIGNVWEWTQDCYVAPYPAAPVNGRAVEAPGACERRTVRGGSWMTRPDRHRSSFRGRDPETAAFAYFGFRVARDLTRRDRAR